MGADVDGRTLERMLREAAATCPTQEEMDAYVLGKAPAGETLLIERHLASGECARCTEAAASARGAVQALGRDRDEAGRASWDGQLRWRRPALACGAALAAVVLLGVLAPRLPRHGWQGRGDVRGPYISLGHNATLGPEDKGRPRAVLTGAMQAPNGKWVLSWSPVTGAVDYIVQIRGADGTVTETRSNGETRLSVDDLPKGERRTWSVLAIVPKRSPPPP